jgi:hypothetical protein
MKAKITALILAFLIISVSAWAFDPGEHMGYSATKTIDALIHTGAGYFYGFVCKTDGTNTVTFQIYDGTDNGDTQIFPDFICQTSSTNRLCVFGTGIATPFTDGLFIDITSSDTTPDYTILYRGK